MSIWIGLGALTLVAMAFLLWPWWRLRSQGKESTYTLFGILGMLPAVTVGAYLYLGAPGILEEQALTRAQTNYDVEGMVSALEGKLKSKPDDPEGWYALGRAYIAFERYGDAEDALRKAVTQEPKNARFIAQYAEAMALKQNSLHGRPLELIKEALEISYEEEKALELAGLAAFEKENWAETLHYWRRLLKVLPKGTEHHDAIAQGVLTAERKLDARLGDSAVRVPPPPPEPKKAAR